jgi:agarase
MMRSGFGWILVAGVVLGLLEARDASAQIQTPDQQRCLLSLNESLERVLRTQGKEARVCLEDGSRDRLEGSVEDCLTADSRGRVRTAWAKTAKNAARDCASTAPDFGATDVPNVNVTAVQSELALLRDVFGSPFAAEPTHAQTARCQALVLEAVQDCRRAKLEDFNGCKRAGLGDGGIADRAGLEACADRLETPPTAGSAPPAGSRVPHFCSPTGGKIQRRLAQQCSNVGVTLSDAFPGCAVDDPEEAARCLDRAVECRVCQALNQADFLDRDCDAFDDGQKNRSCLGLDRWGGWTGVETAATGRFRVEEIDGVWWFVTPDGHGFFSTGPTNVTPSGDYSPPIDARPYHDNVLAIYGSEEAWFEATLARLKSWNFNTIGAWGRTALWVGRRPYAVVRSFHTVAPPIPDWPAGQTGKRVRDYFSPDWPAAAAARAEDVRFCSEDPYCIGIFTDNELPWGPGPFMVGTHVDAYMSLPAGAPGKRALQELFEERYANDVDAFNESWSQQLTHFDDLQNLDALESQLVCESAAQVADRRAFMRRVAEHYYRAVHDAFRALDPELLILGSRFPSAATGPDSVVAAGPYVDVISINNYQVDPGALNLFRQTGGGLYDNFFLNDPFTDLAEIHALTGKPMMIGEYSYRTPTPDVPVLFPPFFTTLDTQAERADAYERYQREVLSRPYMIGTHWHQYVDQPATGRGDGENSSRFGVVTIEDEPYPELTQRMTEMNALVSQRPIAPPPPASLATAPLAQNASALASTPYPVAGLAALGTLGQRVFSIAEAGSDRTGFYVFILPGANLGGAVSPGPLVLEGGALDPDGNAPLRLAQDATIGILSAVGDIVCLRFSAEGSSGTVSCIGGVGHDATLSRESGEFAAPATVESFLGVDSGPGAATLLVPTEIARLPVGAALDECLTTDLYDPPQLMPLSTAVVTTTKGDTELALEGENFVCGEGGFNWRLEDGPGMFAFGFPAFDGRVPGGDLAAGFLFADRADQCP